MSTAVAVKMFGSSHQAYAIAVAAAGTAALLQWLIMPMVGGHAPFLFFLLALVVAVIFLGRGPALLVLLMGIVDSALRAPPIGSILIDAPQDLAAVLIFAASGVLIVSYGTRLRFITTRAALAEERLALAQKNTGVGIFELNFDAQTAFVSPGLCRMLGREVTPGEIDLGRWLGGLRADEVEESRRVMNEQIAQGVLCYEREQQLTHPDGEMRWLLNRVELEATATGKLRVARGVAVDITERKRMNELLQRAQAAATDNERRFSVALESSVVPFTILTPVRDSHETIVDFMWTYINPAAALALGRQVADLIGRGIGTVLPQAWDAPGLFNRYVGVLESGEQCEFEIQTAATQQGARWYNVLAAPLQGSVAVWFTNITDRKINEETLKEADRRKDEFLATLAHELRNPLAPIRQGVRIAAAAQSNDAQRRWSHALIERQVQHMSLLLDDLLDVSRIGRGTLLLRKSHELLSGVLDAALEAARPHFEAKRHRLEKSLPASPVILDIDPLRIAQVLGNLLTNAAKYTDPEGEIRVGAQREGEHFVIRIKDNGIGLTQEQQAQVFEMFSQVPAALEQSQGGLGIGLALARGLIELHGGSIRASSAGLGHGTEMIVSLPGSLIVSERGGGPEMSTAPPVTAQTNSKRCILVADDNADAADSLAELLRLEGYEVHVAYGGAEALATFTRVEPDAALLDVGMPHVSGLEVVRAIRQHPTGQRATLIAVTGWGQDRDRRLALEAGFDHHLTKPMRPEVICDLIQRGRVRETMPSLQ